LIGQNNASQNRGRNPSNQVPLWWVISDNFSLVQNNHTPFDD
jgi:hypothetical protein